MKKCLYTVNVGRYDDVADVIPTPGWDYILLTDEPDEHYPPAWWPVQFDCRGLTPKAAAVNAMILPGTPILNYEYTVFCDCNWHPLYTGMNRPKANLDVMCGWLQWPDFALAKHHTRNCVYEELDKGAERLGNGWQEKADRQKARYHAEGMPAHAGMWDTGIVIRRNGVRRVDLLCDAWWQAFEEAELPRDQPALAYAIWRTGIKPRDYEPALNNENFSLHPHRKGPGQ